jgi:hypothetical protein
MTARPYSFEEAATHLGWAPGSGRKLRARVVQAVSQGAPDPRLTRRTVTLEALYRCIPQLRPGVGSQNRLLGTMRQVARQAAIEVLAEALATLRDR